MVASNRIICFLGMRGVNCKLSAATTNFEAGRYCRCRRRQALSAANSACANNVAVIYAGLGEKDEAFRWLQRAYDERSHIRAVYLNTDSRWTACVAILGLMNSRAVSECQLLVERDTNATPGDRRAGAPDYYYSIIPFSEASQLGRTRAHCTTVRSRPRGQWAANCVMSRDVRGRSATPSNCLAQKPQVGF
jgi:hypothetical protein